MNLIDAYRYLAALAEHRHFGRAAAACHITQPALSNALRTLERQLGVVIVRRSHQYEGLTAEGEQVLAGAQRVLHEQESLLQALASADGRASGRLVIGAVPTALPIAARFAVRLVERHPGLRPTLRSLASQDIERGLETLAIDIGLGYTDRLDAGGALRLKRWPQYVEHHHLLQGVPAQPAAPDTGSPVAWADAAALPLCLLSPEMHHRAIVDGVFASVGLPVRPVLETNSVLALLAAVAAGGLAAVLPGALVATAVPRAGLLARPLVAPQVLTPIGFMTGAAAPSRALSAALELARDATWLAEAAAHSGALDQRRESGGSRQ
jgi:DNA-binding transcriptional LysR family regulator